MVETSHPVGLPHQILQRRGRKELFCRQRTDGDDQQRLEDPDLTLEVKTATGDLIIRRHPIASSMSPTGKASNHRRDVHPAAKLVLGDPESGKPAKQRRSGRVGEGTGRLLLSRAWRLAHQQNTRKYDTRHRQPGNRWTGTTGEQSPGVLFEGRKIARKSAQGPLCNQNPADRLPLLRPRMTFPN